ncbi:anti-sigma factor antagonist [Streptomyces sp. adm13(2018)]|nr:anti-sigma factor antagonist [Streptomyces sp. adm13(2018)]
MIRRISLQLHRLVWVHGSRGRVSPATAQAVPHPRHPYALSRTGDPVTNHVLTVSTQDDASGARVLVVSGDLDYHSASLLSGAFEEQGFAPGTRYVLDLTELMYCDSTGITVMLSAYQRARAAGCALEIAGVNDDLSRVFRIMGLDQVFTLVPTVEEALGRPTS